MLLVQREDLVVGNSAGIGEVVDAWEVGKDKETVDGGMRREGRGGPVCFPRTGKGRLRDTDVSPRPACLSSLPHSLPEKRTRTRQLPRGHEQGDGEEVRQDRHRVRHVHYLVVLDDLGDKIPRVQIVGNGHTDTEDAHVIVALQHVFHVCLGLAVERPEEVGRVLLREAGPPYRVLLVVLEDASRRVQRHVDPFQVTRLRQIQCPNNVRADRLHLVSLTPINVGATRHARCIQDVCRLHSVQLCKQRLPILQSCLSQHHCLALRLQKLNKLPSDPSILAENQILLLGRVSADGEKTSESERVTGRKAMIKRSMASSFH